MEEKISCLALHIVKMMFFRMRWTTYFSVVGFHHDSPPKLSKKRTFYGFILFFDCNSLTPERCPLEKISLESQ